MRRFIYQKILNFIQNILNKIKIPKDRTSPHMQGWSSKNIKYPYDYFEEDQIKECFKEFKTHFEKAIFMDTWILREYSVKEALKKADKDDFFIEFGVFNGKGINFFSKFLKNIKIYGFDTFEGIVDNMTGWTAPIGEFNLNKKIPTVDKNVELIVGRVEETLENFLKEKNVKNIKFVHIDLDTYKSTKFVLNKIKKFLNKDSYILFDELIGYPGWKQGEYRALIEELDISNYEYIAFSYDRRALIKINN